MVREYKLFKKRKCPGWFLAFKAWARQSKAKTGQAIFSELSRATRIKSGIHTAMINLSELGFFFFNNTVRASDMAQREKAPSSMTRVPSLRPSW